MFEEVKKIIVETLSCDEDKVTPDASLTDDLEIIAAAVLHDELLALLIHSDFQVAVVCIFMLDIDPVGQVALRFSLCELNTDGILCHITDFQLTTTERLLGKCDNGAAE